MPLRIQQQSVIVRNFLIALQDEVDIQSNLSFKLGFDRAVQVLMYCTRSNFIASQLLVRRTATLLSMDSSNCNFQGYTVVDY